MRRHWERRRIAVAQVLGPHRIPLLAHAHAGKADAVVRYLETLKI